MKKLLLTLSALALAVTGASLAGAQYYNASYYSTTHVPSTSYQYTYGAAIGSYTIGCTTYYYNTTSGAVTATQNICANTHPGTYNTPTYTYPATYSYPAQYTYPANTAYTSYTNGYNYNNMNSQYCTYGYRNGSWQPCYSSSWFDNNATYNYNNGYNNTPQNYLNCYYDAQGQYICW